jgi:hypothetical protein
MSFAKQTDLNRLHKRLVQLRGSSEAVPDASIVIPVNAQGDLENVLQVATDISNYHGKHTLELILVINNYAPNTSPPEIERYSQLGMNVVGIPNVRRPGEAVGFSARIPGITAACSENVILFDADCRIVDSTALIDWYIKQFRAGAHVAYTHVKYYDLKEGWSSQLRMMIHHSARWVKRAILGIPTTRGSNYAANRSLILKLYQKGMLADEMNVGPAIRAANGRVAYSGRKNLVVLTSGRMFGNAGLIKLLRYFRYRFFYNLRVLRVRSDAARHTKREKDPVRRYMDNKPVK